VDGDGTETGVEVCFACEPDRSECCRRENPLHALPSLSDKSGLIASESFADPNDNLDTGPVVPLVA